MTRDAGDNYRLLGRLDAISAHVATRPDVLAVLGLGSAGVEHDRLDEHSDIDFFMIVEDGAKDRYVADVDWLDAVQPVGLHRELRGERLTATRFIQSYAVDRVLALLRLTGSASPQGRDPFDASRRVEQAHPPEVRPLDEMIPGYGANVAAAAATVAWLRERFDVDPVIDAAIDELIRR